MTQEQFCYWDTIWPADLHFALGQAGFRACGDAFASCIFKVHSGGRVRAQICL